MLVVNRFVVAESDRGRFEPAAQDAVRALGACAGFVRGQLARAADDPRRWCLVTTWESVGAYRRALSTFDVKMRATPLLAEALEEPSAFEVLAAYEDAAFRVAASDRAAESERR